jgi:chromosome segregation ATPase
MDRPKIDPPKWTQIVEKELGEWQRRLDNLKEIADRAEAEREKHREQHRQLGAALDTAERRRSELRLALEQVRTLLQKHAGDDPYWRKGLEETPLGQADCVAERALVG